MSSDEGGSPQAKVAAAARGVTQFETTTFRTLGIGAWLALGIVGVLAVALYLVALVADVAIPLAIAAVLAAVLVPLVDRLERLRLPRWLGSTLVLILALSVVVAVLALVVGAVSSQSDEIWAELTASLQKVESITLFEGASEELIAVAHDLVRVLTSGVLWPFFSSASSFVVGTVLAIFMLLFLLKDWAQITRWTVDHVGLPREVGQNVLDGTTDAFRGYAGGLTIIGAANAAVVLTGALVLGVPLAGTIAVVSFVTSYVPYLGAFAAGAFAVLIAYGSGGLGTALAMLAVVLLANNTIQNLVEPFAFGARLRLHPLAVLLTVVTATLLFGVMGAILAAPLTSAAVRAYRHLEDAGVITRGGRRSA